jgi:predicted RNA binding protein YcfA (HicA-like mRNA interferase family)
MSDIPSLSPKELVKILLKRGYVLDRIRGSHHVFYNPITKKQVVVPMHKKDLPKGLFYAILKQADIDKNDL